MIRGEKSEELSFYHTERFPKASGGGKFLLRKEKIPRNFLGGRMIQGLGILEVGKAGGRKGDIFQVIQSSEGTRMGGGKKMVAREEKGPNVLGRGRKFERWRKKGTSLPLNLKNIGYCRTAGLLGGLREEEEEKKP